MRVTKLTSALSIGLVAIASDSCKPKIKISDSAKPNIIYILADDLGYGDLGCYGQKLIKTPNIDRMAAQGMRFIQHYAGCTVSAPSRSVLMTGLHTGHTPIRGNKEHKPEGQHPLPSSSVTIAKMLRNSGYVTGCFGKWGLGYPGSEGAPENQGFDQFFGYNCQRIAHNYYPYYLWNNNDTVWLKGNQGRQTDDYAQDIIHRKAMQFIRDNKERPFFAFLPYVIPHAELVNPDDSITAMYQGKFPETVYIGVDEGPAYKNGGYGSSPHPKAEFAAMITRLDTYVGEIFAELDRLGLSWNTIVMFSSDNGPHREGGADPEFFKSYGPLRGVKRDLYEGGIRVPFIVWYPPGIKAGVTSNHISAFWDVMPTLAELSGSKTPEDIDGISFLPTLTGKGEQTQHNHLYWEFHEQGGRTAIRQGNWKAVRLNMNKPGDTYTELYNLSEDIHEDHNLADLYPAKVDDLNKLMDQSHIPSDVFVFASPKMAR